MSEKGRSLCEAVTRSHHSNHDVTGAAVPSNPMGCMVPMGLGCGTWYGITNVKLASTGAVNTSLTVTVNSLLVDRPLVGSVAMI